MYVFYWPPVIKNIHGFVKSRKDEYNDVYTAKYHIIYTKQLYYESSTGRNSLKKSQNVLVLIMVHLEAYQKKAQKLS